MSTLDTNRSLRRYQIIGFASIFLMVGVGASWSAFTSINGAVIAPATIVAETNTKRVQHKEGGIIRQILVTDGDRVHEGQDLIILDDTDAKAEVGILDALLVEALAKRARLEAQRDGLATIAYPAELTDRTNEASVDKIMKGQLRLFDAWNTSINGKKDQLGQQVSQITEQISGMEAQIDAKQRQIELVHDDLQSLHDLLDKGLVAKSRVLAMERELARIEGERGELVAAKASSGSRIAETKMRILQLDDEDLTQTLADLREAEGKIAELRERMLSTASRLGRVAIKAPISGDVYQLSVHTIGGVIQPAETLMLIVPEADELVLQAQVAPQSIDQVAMGQKAHVRFPAFNARLTPEVNAEVTHVSADTSQASQTSPPFYLVRLRIDANEMAKLEGQKLKPGMPAEAFIQTAARTPLSYLVKPLTDQIAHTFRER